MIWLCVERYGSCVRRCRAYPWVFLLLVGLGMSACATPKPSTLVAVNDRFDLPATPHVTLRWNDPDNRAQTVAGYYLYYRQSDAEKRQCVDVGKQTSYTLTGLEGGKVYHFWVSAYGTDRVESPPSTISSQRVAKNNASHRRSLTVEAPGVLDNDDTQGGGRVVLASGPVHGIVKLKENGGFIYTPRSDFSGNDNFTYHVTTGARSSNVAMVTIVVESSMASPSSAVPCPPGKNP